MRSLRHVLGVGTLLAALAYANAATGFDAPTEYQIKPMAKYEAEYQAQNRKDTIGFTLYQCISDRLGQPQEGKAIKYSALKTVVEECVFSPNSYYEKVYKNFSDGYETVSYDFDKFIFVLKNLENLEKAYKVIPEKLPDPIDVPGYFILDRA